VAKGKNERFGVIEFAIGADVTAAFRKAVTEVEETDWQALKREVDGQLKETGQDWAKSVLCRNGRLKVRMGRLSLSSYP
jgi:hypothetical protein